MAYEYITAFSSPFSADRPAGVVPTSITIHWWDDPARRPTFDGTVRWLVRPDATASAHYVVEAGRVACIVDPDRIAWHAGDGANGTGNLTSIGIEVNPRWSDGDYQTVAELVRDLRAVYGPLPLRPHRHWKETSCPGPADLARIDRLANSSGASMAHPTIERWLDSAPGRRMNLDGHYGLQCVDAIDLYAEEIFGVPWEQCVGGVGGARELLDRVPDAYWIRIDNNGDPNLIPQRGDVLVYGGNGPNGSNPFGHTAVALSANTSGVSVVQQDGFAPPLIFTDGNWYSNKPAHVAWLGYWNAGTGPIIGWLRPRPEKLKGAVSVQSSAPVTTTKEPFTVAQYENIMRELGNIKSVLASPKGFTWDGKHHPSVWHTLAETQKRVDGMPRRIWHETVVHRGGKKVPVLQDLADGTTHAGRAAELAAKIQGLSAEDLKKVMDLIESLRGSIDVNVTVGKSESA